MARYTCIWVVLKHDYNKQTISEMLTASEFKKIFFLKFSAGGLLKKLHLIFCFLILTENIWPLDRGAHLTSLS